MPGLTVERIMREQSMPKALLAKLILSQTGTHPVRRFRLEKSKLGVNSWLLTEAAVKKLRKDLRSGTIVPIIPTKAELNGGGRKKSIKRVAKARNGGRPLVRKVKKRTAVRKGKARRTVARR